jgi:hypothetical protein
MLADVGVKQTPMLELSSIVGFKLTSSLAKALLQAVEQAYLHLGLLEELL